MTRSFPLSVLFTTLLFSLTSTANPIENSQTNEEKDKPIRIITNNWTSQIVLSEVTGRIFQDMGYLVEYVPLSTADQWGALAHNVANVQVEVWQGTMSEMFNRMLTGNHIVDAGTHAAKTREEWWYPKYVEAVCPGLPDWQALKNCAKEFETPFSAPSGTYFSGPWEKPDTARVRALDLDFKVKVLTQGDDLWVELEKAAKIKRPILLFNWTPNWVESIYEGAFVEFPDHSPKCETDPSWGINKNFAHDCGNPKGGWLKKAASKDMKSTWSCAHETLNNINFTNLQIATASSLVDVKKQSYKQAATNWLKDNRAIWQNWIPDRCKQ